MSESPVDAGRIGGSSRERNSVLLENRTLWQRVHEHLRDEILSNRLQAGSELQETALAEALGVSRGPIREALGRLAAEGLVTVRPRRGAEVRALSKEEVLEAYQGREALEALAVRLAVPRLTQDDLARLQRLTDEMAACAQRGAVDAFFEANLDFHEAIVEASSNRTLRELYRHLVRQMRPYQTRSLALRGNLRRSIAEHRAILRAARAGDADKSAKLMSEHIRVPQRRLQDISDERLDGAQPPKEVKA